MDRVHKTKRKGSTVDAFFALLRAGLWEKNVQVQPYCPLDFDALFQLADEQAIVGVVGAGLGYMSDLKVKKQQVLSFMKEVVYLENQNTAINAFVGKLFQKMRKAGIETLLVKGQGVAQCYERPLWRAVGDVDLFLDDENYEKAKAFLIPFASSVEKEDPQRKHLGLFIDSWPVELHGTLRVPLLRRINPWIDEIQRDTFENKRFRTWDNDGTAVLIPAPDNDVLFVFIHILQHYFSSGVGLRQVCDWCRLLWTYRNEIDRELLEKRLTDMRLMTEWQVFCAYAADYLGAPPEALLLYQPRKCWKRKARMVNRLILDYGNFGQGRDLSYYQTRPYLVRKTISFKYRVLDAFRNWLVFPADAMQAFSRTLKRGFKAVADGE